MFETSFATITLTFGCVGHGSVALKKWHEQRFYENTSCPHFP